jgi:hypothetical protein
VRGVGFSPLAFPGLSGSLGGVPWLFLVSPLRRSLPPSCVPPGSRSRPGRVARWAFPSARPVARFPVSWRWCGLLRSPPLPGLPRLGVAGSPVRAGSFRFVLFAPCPLLPGARRPGACRCRWPRRPFRFAGVARRAAWPPCSRCVAPLALSRGAVAVPAPRRRLGGGGWVFRWPPLAGGLPALGGRRGGLGAGRWAVGGGRVRAGRGSLRALHRAGRAGVRRVRVRVRPCGVRRSVGGAGARRGRWRPRFRFRGVSRVAVPVRFVALGVARCLFLRAGFWLVGLRRVCGWAGRVGRGFPLRFFAAPALGCLVARRRRWCLGARFLVGLVAPLLLPPFRAVFL